MSNVLGRPKALRPEYTNAGTYRVSIKAWNGLRRLAIQHGYMKAEPDARGVVPFLHGLANTQAQFTDTRPDYLRELDAIAVASGNATVWHDMLEVPMPRRIYNVPKSYLTLLTFEHRISSRARQATVARGLSLLRPRSYAPSDTRARVSAALEAIGLGYLTLTVDSSRELADKAPAPIRPAPAPKKLVG